MEIWNSLLKADVDNDNDISINEWYSMWETYAKNPSNELPWQTLYMNFIFDLEDASNDGSIDVDEFSSVYACFGIDIGEAKKAFTHMAKGSSTVTREQFAVLWKEYFITEDPSAPGNFIFGKTSF